MRNLFEFILRYAAVFLFVLLEIICLLLLSASTSYKQWKGGMVIQEMTGPILRQRAKAASYFHLQKENSALLEFQEGLLRKAYNIDMADTAVTHPKDTLQKPLFDYISARIIDNTTSLPDNHLILDKGYNDGIRPGVGVLSDQGVVGIVKNVSPNFSTVMSLLHSKFNLSVILKDGIVTGVLYWDGRNHRRAILRNVSSLDQIKVGDTLVTHHSLIFPPNYPVGTVSKIRKEVEDGFYTLEVRLGTHFDRISQVWVVKNNFMDELNQLKDSIKYE